MDTGFEGLNGSGSRFWESLTSILGKLQTYYPYFYLSLTSGERELVLSSHWLKQVIVEIASPPLSVDGLLDNIVEFHDDSVSPSSS